MFKCGLRTYSINPRSRSLSEEGTKLFLKKFMMLGQIRCYWRLWILSMIFFGPNLLFAEINDVENNDYEQNNNRNVIVLNDSNFEHETQASGGMTTGSWLVFFKAERCVHCKALMPHFESLAATSDSEDDDQSTLDLKELLYNVVFATVDVPSNRETAVRFGIRGFPTVIMLHKHKVYSFKGYGRTKEGLVKFITDVLKGKVLEKGESIPTPPSAMGKILKIMKVIGLELLDAATGKSGPEGYGIILMLFALLLIFGGIVSLFFLPAQKEKSS